MIASLLKVYPNNPTYSVKIDALTVVSIKDYSEEIQILFTTPLEAWQVVSKLKEELERQMTPAPMEVQNV